MKGEGEAEGVKKPEQVSGTTFEGEVKDKQKS